MMNCLGVQLKWNDLRQKQSDISGIYSGKRRIAYGSYGRFSSMIYRLKNKKQQLTHRIHGAGIYANIWGILMVNVTIYSIHGSYGLCFIVQVLLNYQRIVADKMRIHQLTLTNGWYKFVYIPWKMVGCGTSTQGIIDDIILDKCLRSVTGMFRHDDLNRLWHSQLANWKDPPCY